MDNIEETNVNNLNGIPNFGHGLPEDGIVIAGITDVVIETPIEDADTVDIPVEEAETVDVLDVPVETKKSTKKGESLE